ncbi:MAG: hypothetical protein HY922_12765 [Elusimicrobia bacterium]|nr:hypothetical protein [Elusimicrobiota bacterium]
MRVAIDAGGSPLGIEPIVEASVRASRGSDVEILIFGPGEPIRRALLKLSVRDSDARIRAVDAFEEIGPGEEPAAACREKPEASVLLAAEAVSRGEADALVSAGNPGALSLAAHWSLKRLPGVLKAPFACLLPTYRGKTLLLDAGANIDSKPWHLLQYALLGSAYVRRVIQTQNPTVGLLSMGEAGPSSGLLRETLPLLKYSGLSFAGLVDARAAALGQVDLVVCDGFAGSVCRKSMGGLCESFFAERGPSARGVFEKLGRALLKEKRLRERSRWNRPEFGCAALLGVDAPVVHCRGGSPEEIAAAVRMAGEIAASEMNEEIRGRIRDAKSSAQSHQEASAPREAPSSEGGRPPLPERAAARSASENL